MDRVELINFLIATYSYRSYLEIGIDNPNNCFNRVNILYKTGVDPKGGGTHEMTSDDFFEANTSFFGIVFVDGLHLEKQVIRDVDNSLKWLDSDGVILVHDIDPDSEESQNEERTTARWFGSVWKAWTHFRATRPDLEMYSVDMDCGMGIIRKGNQKIYSGPYETYQDFVSNRIEILNLR